MRSKMLMTSIALCVGLSGNVHATSDPLTPIPFRLEAQPLPDALRAWAKQAKMQLIWPDTLAVPSRLTAEVSELLSPEAALSKLLAGSGLAYEFVADAVVTLEPAVNNAAAKGTQRDGNSDRAPSDDVEEVVVTGTHIRGLSPVGSRLVVLDAEDIRHNGYSTTEQLLQSLPQNIRSGAYGESADARLSAAAGASSNVTRGSSLNLRGLGATATLVLVNGHRIAASGLGHATDISLISIDQISRVEVLLDGASAIYGADAIAGVINIILKRELDGAETRAEYGVTSPSGREEVRISQSVGTHWDGGSILTVASSLEQTQLSVDERSFTLGVKQPESIFPRSRQLSALVSGHQRLGDASTVRADVQYGETSRYAQGATTTGPVEFPVDIDRLNAFMGLEFQSMERWNVELKTSISRQGTDFSFIHLPRGSPAAVENSEVQYLVQHQWTTGLMANGRIARTPAGEIGLAVGGEHRKERYSRRLISATGVSQGAARTIDSAYAELHLPIFGDTNGIPGARRMNLSLAGRYDEYSDFGSVVNPKFGFSWMPMSGVEVRWTYSHSFRAPATGSELYAHTQGTSPVISIYSFTGADGSASPMALLTGSKALRPERARHWTVGFSVRPEIEGLEIGFTYYDISYYDRIIALPLDTRALFNPSLQSFVRHYDSPADLDAALEQEVAERRYVDRTGEQFEGGAFGAHPENLVTQLFDARIANASFVHTSGLDFTGHYTKQLMAGRWGLAWSANYIQRMQTALAPGIPATEVVGTTGNPAGLRAKTSTYFTRDPWDTALTVNFTEGYADTTSTVRRPVDSYVTVDMHIRYTMPKTHARYLDGLSIALSGLNLLNEQPPYIAGSRATRFANYDAVNADPLGRVISLQISKAW